MDVLKYSQEAKHQEIRLRFVKLHTIFTHEA